MRTISSPYAAELIFFFFFPTQNYTPLTEGTTGNSVLAVRPVPYSSITQLSDFRAGTESVAFFLKILLDQMLVTKLPS